MIIHLLSEAGEFCSSRGDPSIPKLRKIVKDALARGEKITVSRQGTKGLTVSFLDEWLGNLIIEFGLERIEANVLFDPPLEPFLERQLDRSKRLRSQ